jgi:iron complex outermembrane receptor protein
MHYASGAVRHAILPIASCSLVFAASSAPVIGQTVEQLDQLSIEDLAQVNVSSVSKTDQPLADAPASIYVISNEDIVLSGATIIPDMLRLAPALEVYQQSPGSWVVTARGLNGSANAQSYSNKLLVLVDGRTVYSPLFSGVYWDLPDVLPQDVDRIEVISGPGATLWGANAVNGVINVITRKAAATAGGFISIQAGRIQRTASARFGGAIGDTLTYRIFARAIEEEGAYSKVAARTQNAWRRQGGGFRLDWVPNATDTVALQGEAFSGRLGKGSPARESTAGRSLTLQWNRKLSATSELEIQGFYDRVERDSRAAGGGKFFVDTFDLELQHSFVAGRHRVVLGSGARVARYKIDGTASFFFRPDSRDLFLANAFAQDSVSITPALTLTAGIKIEKDPYVGASLLPEVRIAWKPSPVSLVWAAMSRAVRSPTPFDSDVEERAGIVSLSGNRNFQTEKLTAYELGFRAQPIRNLSFSATGYYHQYDDLRSIEIRPGPGLTLAWDNLLSGHGYGAEVWGDWRVTPWWTLSAGAVLLRQKFRFAAGASGILGAGQLGNDAPHRFKLHSSVNLASNLTVDADFRAVGALKGSSISAYQELGGRLAWTPVPSTTVTLSGANLLHRYHREYEGGDRIPRKLMAGVELRF